MDLNSKIYIAGHQGMVGSAIVRELYRQGYINLLLPTREELDLRCQSGVERFFKREKPQYVFLAAAKVGGISANRKAADFIYDNLAIEMNIIHSAWQNDCKKLVFVGSACIYPSTAMQPIQESSLLTSELGKSHEAYALAKISGIKYCEYLNQQYGTEYISVIPNNLYGLNDNYNPQSSHVLPAMIARFHEAKIAGAATVTCWGDGSSRREFLFADDFANLCIFLMDHYHDSEPINAGTGYDMSIRELAEMVAKVVGYSGDICWDITKPNGAARRLLDNSKIKSLGWNRFTNLEEGISLTYHDFLHHQRREGR